MHQVVPKLWIGGVQNAHDERALRRVGVTHICTCCERDVVQYTESFKYVKIAVRDPLDGGAELSFIANAPPAAAVALLVVDLLVDAVEGALADDSPEAEALRKSLASASGGEGESRGGGGEGGVHFVSPVVSLNQYSRSCVRERCTLQPAGSSSPRELECRMGCAETAAIGIAEHGALRP